MLYHSSHQEFSKVDETRGHKRTDSYWLSDQVFTGQYWDEFCLSSLLCFPPQRVLMLGLGHGGGIRPLLSPHLDCHITAVDIDPQSVKECEALYHSYFPKIRFNAVVADASTFLHTTSEKFDVVWIDLFDSVGYAPNLQDRSFYSQVKNHLQTNGSLACNAFGVASHLLPWVKNSAYHVIHAFLTQEFGNVISVPYRRNCTLIASRGTWETKTEQDFPRNLSHLTEADAGYVRLAELRLQEAKRVKKVSSGNFQPSELLYEIIKSRQLEGWSVFLEALNVAIKTHSTLSNVHLFSTQSLASLMADVTFSKELLGWLVDKKSPLCTFFPTFLGSYIHETDQVFDWFLQFVIENWRHLNQKMPSEFILYFLPQCYAMARSQSSHYGQHLQDLLKIFDTISPQGERQ